MKYQRKVARMLSSVGTILLVVTPVLARSIEWTKILPGSRDLPEFSAVRITPNPKGAECEAIRPDGLQLNVMVRVEPDVTAAGAQLRHWVQARNGGTQFSPVKGNLSGRGAGEEEWISKKGEDGRFRGMGEVIAGRGQYVTRITVSFARAADDGTQQQAREIAEADMRRAEAIATVVLARLTQAR